MKKPFKIEIANADPELKRFLTGIIAIFTDPILSDIAKRVRDSRYFIMMGDDGEPALGLHDTLPNPSPTSSASREIPLPAA